MPLITSKVTIGPLPALRFPPPSYLDRVSYIG
jgi:hypothetical protein